MDAIPFYALAVLGLVNRYHACASVAGRVTQAFLMGVAIVTPSVLFLWI